jgi:hypothetical protein
MKKFAAGVAMGMLVSSGMSFAAAGLSHNGIFWQQLSQPAKAGYINGYRDAMDVSVQEVNTLSIAASYLHWKSGDKIIHQLTQELSMAQIDPEEAVRRLNSLYANPKYSELDLGQALQLLAAQTSSNSPADNGAHPATGTMTK